MSSISKASSAVGLVQSTTNEDSIKISRKRSHSASAGTSFTIIITGCLHRATRVTQVKMTSINGHRPLDSLPPPPPPPAVGSNPPAPPSDIAIPPPPEDVPPPPPESSIEAVDVPEAPIIARKKQGWSNKTSRQPLSVEEIIKKKKEADEAASKVSLPLYLCSCQMFTFSYSGFERFADLSSFSLNFCQRSNERH